MPGGGHALAVTADRLYNRQAMAQEHTSLVQQAQGGYSRLWGDYHRPDLLSVDDGLANMPGLWRYGVDNVNV